MIYHLVSEIVSGFMDFIYKDAKKNQFLERKHDEFQEAIKYYGGVA